MNWPTRSSAPLANARSTSLLLTALLAVAACAERRVELVHDPAATDSGATQMDAAQAELDATRPDPTPDAAQPDSSVVADAATMHTPSAHCGSRPCACDDGTDNDGDGLSDGLDPECTGAYDDDESSFGIGKPNKQNQCRDCFWDDNAGFGDDGCRYPAECLTGAQPNGRGNCSSCSVSQDCLDACQARAPNGCDCFGCCEIRVGGDSVYIELDDGCDSAKLDDPAACPPCVPSSQCANACGRCELCLGKRPSDLPADCIAKTPGAPAYSCDDGLKVCATSADCVGASYCLQGCCVIDLL